VRNKYFEILSTRLFLKKMPSFSFAALPIYCGKIMINEIQTASHELVMVIPMKNRKFRAIERSNIDKYITYLFRAEFV